MLTMKTATTPQANTAAGESHAVRIIEGICCLAGSPTFLDDLRRTLRWAGMVRAIDQHDTPKVFDWLVETVSLQGISDGVARDYAELHGGITWVEIDASLAARPSCPKLPGYWQFWDCRYHKGTGPAPSPTTCRSARCRSISCETVG